MLWKLFAELRINVLRQEKKAIPLLVCLQDVDKAAAASRKYEKMIYFLRCPAQGMMTHSQDKRRRAMIGKVKLLAAALVVACCYALAGCGGSTSGSSGGTSGGSSGGSTSNQRTSTSSGAEKQHLGVGNDKADHVPLDDPGAIMDQLGGDADIIRNSSSNKIDSDICPRILDEYLSNVKQLDVLNHGDTHATDMQLTAKNLVRNPGNCISLGGGHKG